MAQGEPKQWLKESCCSQRKMPNGHVRETLAKESEESGKIKKFDSLTERLDERSFEIAAFLAKRDTNRPNMTEIQIAPSFDQNRDILHGSCIRRSSRSKDITVMSTMQIFQRVQPTRGSACIHVETGPEVQKQDVHRRQWSFPCILRVYFLSPRK